MNQSYQANSLVISIPMDYGYPTVLRNTRTQDFHITWFQCPLSNFPPSSHPSLSFNCLNSDYIYIYIYINLYTWERFGMSFCARLISLNVAISNSTYFVMNIRIILFFIANSPSLIFILFFIHSSIRRQVKKAIPSPGYCNSATINIGV